MCVCVCVCVCVWIGGIKQYSVHSEVYTIVCHVGFFKSSLPFRLRKNNIILFFGENAYPTHETIPNQNKHFSINHIATHRILSKTFFPKNGLPNAVSIYLRREENTLYMFHN